MFFFLLPCPQALRDRRGAEEAEERSEQEEGQDHAGARAQGSKQPVLKQDYRREYHYRRICFCYDGNTPRGWTG